MFWVLPPARIVSFPHPGKIFGVSQVAMFSSPRETHVVPILTKVRRKL
jgi:hypothetical protein